MAAPLAWYLMDRWLAGFAYRTELSALLFVAAGLLAVALVNVQALRAVNTNPVKPLRSEQKGETGDRMGRSTVMFIVVQNAECPYSFFRQSFSRGLFRFNRCLYL